MILIASQERQFQRFICLLYHSHEYVASREYSETGNNKSESVITSQQISFYLFSSAKAADEGTIEYQLPVYKKSVKIYKTKLILIISKNIQKSDSRVRVANAFHRVQST